MIADLAARLRIEAPEDCRISLTAEQRNSLKTAYQPIENLTAADLAEIVNRLSGTLPPGAENERTIAGVIDVLEEAAAPRGQVPALIQFVAALADVNAGVHDQLWSWIDEFARITDFPQDDLTRQRRQQRKAQQQAQQQPSPTPRTIRAVLSIGLAKPYEVDRYEVTRWLRGEHDRISHKLESPLFYSMENLQSGGEQMLAEFHPILGSVNATVVEFEFFLDRSVITVDVDRWRVGSKESAPRVGDRFIAVTHSIDRLHEGAYHASWQERWEKLKGSTDDKAARWMRWKDEVPPTEDLIPDGDDYDALRYVLAECESLCCLGLHGDSEMVGKTMRAATAMQVEAAMQEGLPAVIWRRDEGDVADLRALLSELAANGRLIDLPAKVHQLRRNAKGKPHLLGSHVSLIWDNYDDRTALIAGLESPREAQGAADGSE